MVLLLWPVAFVVAGPTTALITLGLLRKDREGQAQALLTVPTIVVGTYLVCMTMLAILGESAVSWLVFGLWAWWIGIFYLAAGWFG